MRECSTCGAKDYRITDAQGHSYTSEVVAPTCLGEGYTLHTCSVCGASYRDGATEALEGHESLELHTLTSTCTERKVLTYCVECEAFAVELLAPTLGHTPSDWITDTEPTCAAEGSKHKECTECGALLESEAIPKKDHTPSDEVYDRLESEICQDER